MVLEANGVVRIATPTKPSSRRLLSSICAINKSYLKRSHQIGQGNTVIYVRHGRLSLADMAKVSHNSCTDFHAIRHVSLLVASFGGKMLLGHMPQPDGVNGL